MSIFNIKLKTKNGNDVKKKQMFTVYIKTTFKKHALTGRFRGFYTYRIMHNNGIEDPVCALELKNSENINNSDDFIMRVLLNMCHILVKLTDKYKIDPDFILFITPDLQRAGFGAIRNILDANNEKEYERKNYSQLREEHVEILEKFVKNNPNTSFRLIDPEKNKEKYAKSIKVCGYLKSTLESKLTGQLQITGKTI